MNRNKCIAEFIGTFALVFFGAGAVVSGTSLVGVALAHGLAIMCMIYALGHISGGHFNPAVTISLFVSKYIDAQTAVSYVVSQLLGGIFAATALAFLFASSSGALGTTVLASNVSFAHGIIIEAVLTFFLVLVICGAALDQRASSAAAGLAVGCTIVFDILAAGKLTGASINPARSFGPALISGSWENHLVYWIGPILGGSLAALLYKKCFRNA